MKHVFVFDGDVKTGKSTLAWEAIDYSKADIFDDVLPWEEEDLMMVRKKIMESEKPFAIIIPFVLDELFIDSLIKDGHKVSIVKFEKVS